MKTFREFLRENNMTRIEIEVTLDKKDRGLSQSFSYEGSEDDILELKGDLGNLDLSNNDYDLSNAHNNNKNAVVTVLHNGDSNEYNIPYNNKDEIFKIIKDYTRSNNIKSC